MWDTDRYLNQQVEVNGWIRSNRDRRLGFIALNDGTHFNTVQVVYEKTFSAIFPRAHYRVGAAITVQGKVVATPQANSLLR